MPALKEEQLNKRYFDSFVGGINYYYGPRQIKDNESPDAIDCDFKGKAGIGNRDGYTQAGTVADSRTAIYGMGEYYASGIAQLIKFASDGSDIALYYGTGGAWTAHTDDVFTDAVNMDAIQGGGLLYTANGTDAMYEWNGSSWAATTNGTKGYYPAYYNYRLWVRDETNKDQVHFSGQYSGTNDIAADKLGDYTDASAGWIKFDAGSGAEVTGMIAFQDYLFVFMTNSIWRLSPATAANTFTVELITRAVGCISYRSITQVEEDLFFAGNDGVYSLGEVANYTAVRTTNKSTRIQEIFDGLSAANKKKLVGKYHNFKYHLFYSLLGTNNDSCQVYDIRYKGWQDWRNIAANDATLYTTAAGQKDLFFGEPITGKVHKLYSGSDNDGTDIDSYWKSKSFDYDVSDVIKLFMHTTFTLGALGGTVILRVIFNDNEISATKTLTQDKPQGGFGKDCFGRMAFGDAVNTINVTQVRNVPQRLKAKGKKFAIQYQVLSSSGSSWRLDNISQTFVPFSHYKFPSANKL